MTIQQQIDRLWKVEQQIDGVYEEYAKSVGLSYTGLCVLHLIYSDKIYTQKAIAEQLFLPKQTVNTVVSNFCKKGILELNELLDDRRHKTIHITEKGKALINDIMPQLEQAELYGLEQLSDIEREQFITYMERFAKAYVAKMKK